MPLDVILGTQWGDEGKGRITDLLAQEAQAVARFNGGDNAGHTISVSGQVFKLHLIPSGIVHENVRCLMGGGMVVNPASLVAEIDQLAAMGVDVSPERLKLSSMAHIITPAHIALDGADEARRGAELIGTTKRGIGPAYADKASRTGLRAGSMQDPERFAQQVMRHERLHAERLEKIYVLQAPDPADSAQRYRVLAERLRPYLADVGSLVDELLRANALVVAEGAQGTLLDLDHGTYPFVTSSSPTLPGALLGLGVGPRHLRRIIGVTKAFQTRVGSGIFPTELTDEIGTHLRGTGKNPWDEFGTTTGRPRRCGWLDLVLLRYAVRVNSFSELMVTKLDILSGLSRLQLCDAYRKGATLQHELQGSPSELEGLSPDYIELPGWEADLFHLQHWAELPPEAQAYVRRIEQACGLPVTLVSVGPSRDQTLLPAGRS